MSQVIKKEKLTASPLLVHVQKLPCAAPKLMLLMFVFPKYPVG